MQKAAFSIVNYQFNKVNIDLSNHKSGDISLSFDTRGIFDESQSIYELEFSVIAFNNDLKESPFVSVRCVGVFKFEEVNLLNEIPDFFYRNSIAILFPYVRSYISIITSQANVPGIILPTLNLSSLESGLRKNTILK